MEKGILSSSAQSFELEENIEVKPAGMNTPKLSSPLIGSVDKLMWRQIWRAMHVLERPSSRRRLPRLASFQCSLRLFQCHLLLIMYDVMGLHASAAIDPIDDRPINTTYSFMCNNNAMS